MVYQVPNIVYRVIQALHDKNRFPLSSCWLIYTHIVWWLRKLSTVTTDIIRLKL